MNNFANSGFRPQLLCTDDRASQIAAANAVPGLPFAEAAG